MSNISELIEVIKKRERLRFDSEVATYMGIDRKSLAVAKSRKVIPISYINWYCKHYDIQRQKFEGHLKGSGTRENKSEENVEYTIIAQRETIELQKEKIKKLEADVKAHQLNPVQSTHWDSLEYDFRVSVKLTFKGFSMGRTIAEVHGLDNFAKILGYSKKEMTDLWDIGTYYKEFAKHPIDTILTKDSIDVINQKNATLPMVFNQLKDMIGNHYIPIPISYKAKDNTVIHTITYNKVNWLKKTVESKVQVLKEG